MKFPTKSGTADGSYKACFSVLVLDIFNIQQVTWKTLENLAFIELFYSFIATDRYTFN